MWFQDLFARYREMGALNSFQTHTIEDYLYLRYRELIANSLLDYVKPGFLELVSLSLSLDLATTEWPIEFIIYECSTEFDHSFSKTEIENWTWFKKFYVKVKKKIAEEMV